MLLLLLLLVCDLIASKCELPQAFKIPFDAGKIDELKSRLDHTNFPDEVGSDWSYGVPLHIMRNLTAHLRSHYDFQGIFSKLSEDLPQFTLPVDDMSIHFVHKLSSNPHAIPLLFVHGWPGSFFECSKIIPLLTEPQNYGGKAEDAFHVVCPSLPGYGFSSRPSQPGFDQQRAAELFAKLMVSLGYEQYYLQGGDWGSVVVSLLAAMPGSNQRVIGLHLNMVPALPPVLKGMRNTVGLVTSMFVPWLFYSGAERSMLLDMPLSTIHNSGYFHQQSTFPQTLAMSLSDSPVGLLTWIVDKFYHWSDCNGDVFSRFSADELLTNFMIYWMTNTAGSSVRFYYEFWRGPNKVFMKLFSLDVEVPTAVAVFPKEFLQSTRYWAGSYYSDIVHWTEMPRGGHFAALEEPLLLANDIWTFRRRLRGRAKAGAVGGNENKKDL